MPSASMYGTLRRGESSQSFSGRELALTVDDYGKPQGGSSATDWKSTRAAWPKVQEQSREGLPPLTVWSAPSPCAALGAALIAFMSYAQRASQSTLQ
jgi:hypothetical protein